MKRRNLNRRLFLSGASSALVASSLGITGCRPDADGSLDQTVVGSPTATSDTSITELRSRLHGKVLLPTDLGYDVASAARNGRYSHLRPSVVAQCDDESDVLSAVLWAQEHGVKPTVRGGGHSYAGYSSTTGFLIDVSMLNTVKVNAEAGTAFFGGAALNADIFAATRGGRWLLPGGTCGQVGLGGLTLGGGIGYHTHWAGLTADHLVSSRIVTADGSVLDVHKDSHPDLFWALRGGGGGNFGVNTSFTFNLAEIPRPESVYFRFEWRGAEAATAVFATVDAILQTAPPELNMSTSAQASPIGTGGPREAIDTVCRGHFLGDVDDLTDLLAPLVIITGHAKAPVISSRPFWDTAGMFLSNEATAHSWGDISRFVAAPVPDNVYAKMIDLLAQCDIRTTDCNASVWSLGWVGGSIVDRFGPTDTAYVHRGMKTLLRPTPIWSNEASRSVANALMGWTLDVTSLIDPHSPGNSYQNFPNRSLDGWEDAYYGQNWNRLRKIKTRYDPHNMFTNPQGIPPLLQ